jgi:hypothetical protein
MKIPSEFFNSSYCIFIDKNEKKIYKESIEKYKNLGVRLIEGEFENSPSCIVIPNKLDIFNIEKELYNLDESKNGFWGQFGVGYAGKTWKEI